MATPLQSIDPALLALQTAKKAMPASPNTQAVAKPSLNVQRQQPQAISTNITPPVAKIGGISSPFWAPNINSTPVLWWATPQEIGTRAKELQSLPKAIPQTGTSDNQKYVDLQIDIKKWMPFEKMKELYSDIPESAQSDLYNDLKKGMPIEKIPELYPELQWSVQKQWWAKWIIAPTWWFNIPQVQPIAPTTEWNYNPLKTIANAPWSLLNVWINIANMWLSPIQTLKTIAKTAIWWATNLWEIIWEKLAGKENYQEAQQKLLQWEWPVSDFFRFMNESGDNAAQVWDYFKWYADKEELQRRIEEDPAWVLSDVLTVAWYAWWAIQKAWQVSKLWKVAQIWQKITSLEKYDPYTYLPKQAKVLAEKPWLVGKIATPIAWVLNPAETYMNQWKNIIDWIKKAPAVTSDLYQWTKEAYARKVVWLTENTVEAIKSNKYLSEAEGGKLTRDSLTQSAGTLLNKQIQDLSETGRWYSQIRESWIPIDVSSKKPAINKILSDNTIKVDWKGILDFTDSAIESKADQAQLQKVYDYFKRWEVTPDIYLNKKKAIRDMTDFSQGNADQTNRILKQIGSEWKSAWHNSIPELKQLDAIYEPQITDINEIRSKIFDKDWNLREWATSYIMNSLWVNRDVTLQKLEKLMPEISEQVKAIKAVEDINSSKWIRPWTYNKTAAIAWWAKAWAEAGKAIWSYLWSVGEFVWWWIGWIVWAIWWIIATDPAYIINKLRWVDVKLPDEIVQKIQAKQVLSTAQKNKVNDILSSLDKKKQQVIIEQVKKDQKYPIKLKQEWPQTLWATLPKPTPKTPPITVEKWAIGMWTPKVNNTPVIPPKATVAPSVWAPKKWMPKLWKETLEQVWESIKEFWDFKDVDVNNKNEVFSRFASEWDKQKLSSGISRNTADKMSMLDTQLRRYGHKWVKNTDFWSMYKLLDIYDNTEFFTKYPSLKDTNVIFADFHTPTKRWMAVWSDIYINSKLYNKDPELLRSTIVHEIQHMKQDIRWMVWRNSEMDERILSKQYIEDPREIDAKRKQDAYLQFAKSKKTLPPLPKKWLPKLWKEIMEQDITNSDTLINEAKKYKTADEFVNSRKSIHRPPDITNWSRLDNLSDSYWPDIYTKEALDYYGDRNYIPDRKAIDIIKRVRNNPDAEVTIYRTIEKWDPKEFYPWDRVSITKEYAKEHGQWPLKWNAVLIEKNVKVQDLVWNADSLQEYWYRPNQHTDYKSDQLKQIREQANKKPLPPLPKKWK